MSSKNERKMIWTKKKKKKMKKQKVAMMIMMMMMMMMKMGSVCGHGCGKDLTGIATCSRVKPILTW